MEKSVLTPSTRIRYLGHIIDSVQFKVYLPDEKIEKIISKCESVLRNRKIKCTFNKGSGKIHWSYHVVIECN